MGTELFDDDRFFQLSILAAQVFTPTTPVPERDLFSGRRDQIRRVTDVIFQRGQHAVIFGDRGVGKTSLANVLQSFLPKPLDVSSTRVNSDGQDTFMSIWQKVFNAMNLIRNENIVGFMPNANTKIFDANSFIVSEESVPEQVRQALIRISAAFALTIIIIDEFDKLPDTVRSLFADFIKSLSDYDINVTIVLIGVGDSIEHLLEQHLSVSRALVEIKMPRMTLNETEQIVTTGLGRLGMSIDEPVLEKIKKMSMGLPYYTHLISLHATRIAIDRNSLNITKDDLNSAIAKSIEDAQHSIRSNYHKAIRSAVKDNLFEDVLLACAMAEVNELGEFPAIAVKEPMYKVTGRTYQIPGYAKHLAEFSESKRGNIIIKTGERKFYRYKFSDPLMQPFIIMRGLQRGKDI